jgi:hypothetical protein
MDYRELLEKYNLLLSENSRLAKENDWLKAQLGITKSEPSENRIAESTPEKNILEDQPADTAAFSNVNNTSDSISKIKLFMSLFKGRDDVYAKKWENKKKATSGFSPVCLNQWQVGLCEKPKTPCSKCINQLYVRKKDKGACRKLTKIFYFIAAKQFIWWQVIDGFFVSVL